MIDLGANAIIVQHSHCPGSYENYKGCHIIYGQGNLIFDWPNKDKPFYKGFLVKLSIREKTYSEIEFIPYSQSDNHVGARKLMGKDKDLFLTEIYERSKAIKDDSYVREKWLEFCRMKKHEYLVIIKFL